MSLAPIPPVSRRGQWRDLLRLADQVSGELMNISGYTIQIDIMPAHDGAPRYGDYGRRFSARDGDPLISIVTNAANTGNLIKVDDYTLAFVFPREQMLGLCPGSYCRSVLAFVDGEYDEVQRDYFTVS